MHVNMLRTDSYPHRLPHSAALSARYSIFLINLNIKTSQGDIYLHFFILWAYCHQCRKLYITQRAWLKLQRSLFWAKIHHWTPHDQAKHQNSAKLCRSLPAHWSHLLRNQLQKSSSHQQTTTFHCLDKSMFSSINPYREKATWNLCWRCFCCLVSFSPFH